MMSFFLRSMFIKQLLTGGFFFFRTTIAFSFISFEWEDSQHKKSLRVTITADRLVLGSVSVEDIPLLQALYADRNVMERFTSSKPIEPHVIEGYVREIWVPLLVEHPVSLSWLCEVLNPFWISQAIGTKGSVELTSEIFLWDEELMLSITLIKGCLEILLKSVN